ncbi:MAG: hypothetical protein RJA22_196 [Verrucomicrobiota bacterium]|jgi:hypothetical protein
MRRSALSARARALVAGACVAAHCLGLAWFPALLSAGAALLGNDHTIDLRWNGREAAVVLRHSSDDAGQLPTHSHHTLTALLVSLAHPASPFCPDHVVEFGCCDEQLAPARQLSQALDSPASPAPVTPAPCWSLSWAAPALVQAPLRLVTLRQDPPRARTVEFLI